MTKQIRAILAPLRPIAVYVFGSTASGRARVDSDLDLGILPEQPLAACDLVDAKLQLAEHFGRDVDLIDLATASTVLRKEVLAGGRLLFETNSIPREEFEMYTLSDYARLNEERAEVLAVLGQPLNPDA